MASGWASFRKHWVRPEVYPLIGSMAAALGVCGAALLNKARDPSVAWNKAKRRGGDIMDDVEEVVPMWSSAKHNSTSIFSKSQEIMDTKRTFIHESEPVSVKIGGEDDAEEENEHVSLEGDAPEADAPEADAADEPLESQSGDSQPAHVDHSESNHSDTSESDDATTAPPSAPEKITEALAPAVHVMDEAAETVKAAVDKAIESASAVVSHDSSDKSILSTSENAEPEGANA